MPANINATLEEKSTENSKKDTRSGNYKSNNHQITGYYSVDY